MLSIINADHAVGVIEPLGDDLEGMIELRCPLKSPPSTQVEGLFSGIRRVFRPPPSPLKGKDASLEQSMEGPQAKAQPSMTTPTTEEDTRPKCLICGKWRKMHLAS